MAVKIEITGDNVREILDQKNGINVNNRVVQTQSKETGLSANEKQLQEILNGTTDSTKEKPDQPKVVQSSPRTTMNFNRYENSERILVEAFKRLDDAFILQQELSTVSKPIEQNTIKALKKVYKHYDMSDFKKKMAVLRSKWYPCDSESLLTYKGIQLYQKNCVLNIKNSSMLVHHANKYLLEQMKPPKQNPLTNLRRVIDLEQETKDFVDKSFMPYFSPFTPNSSTSHLGMPTEPAKFPGLGEVKMLNSLLDVDQETDGFENNSIVTLQNTSKLDDSAINPWNQPPSQPRLEPSQKLKKLMKVTQKLHYDAGERLASETEDFKLKSTQYISPVERSVMSLRQKQQQPLTHRSNRKSSNMSGDFSGQLTQRILSQRGSDASKNLTRNLSNPRAHI